MDSGVHGCRYKHSKAQQEAPDYSYIQYYERVLASTLFNYVEDYGNILMVVRCNKSRLES